ncbi:MAG: division/cell wall cluster transcriptional repressor MraZ [Acidimicrobiia bacterium]|nr:division/cell wall cluster transcriptional repressor MraZ [Acidimicrobiia bacterium]
MFVGEYQHTMDGKGRVVLPARFRKALEKDGCVLTKGQDECVFIWATDDWQKEAKRMKQLPDTNSRSRAFKRSFFTGSEPQSLDAQGRITIPHSFRSFAALEKDLAVVGVAERIEIWDAERWSQVSADADQVFAHIEEDFTYPAV